MDILLNSKIQFDFLKIAEITFRKNRRRFFPVFLKNEKKNIYFA
jgi:hypothetical protein